MSSFVSSSHDFTNASASASYAMRFCTSSILCSLSKMVEMLHAIPKRSRSCGRSSPSSGFPLPIMMNFAGCVMEMPSRSTVFHPPAAESRTTSTRESSRRFTSSMYSNPRLALARRPASYAFTPSASARSMSMVPQMRSSVVPRGTSTMGTRMVVASRASPALYRSRASGPMSWGSVGEELNASFFTTGISGRRSWSARTATDLPVPRSPMIKQPPILES